MKIANFKTFVAGAVIGGVLFSGIGYATSNLTTIEVDLEPVSFKNNEQAIVDTTIESSPVEIKMNHKVITDDAAELPEEVQKWVSEHKQGEYTGSLNSNGHTYILVARGESPNPGYGVELTRVFAHESNIMVQARYTEPEPNMSYIQVITYPTLLIKIDQTSKEVKFEISGKTKNTIK